MLLRWAISSTESPSGASTSTRSPPALMKVIFGILKALQCLIFQALNDYYRQCLFGAVSCHTGLDLVKAVAFERRLHRPVHTGLGERMARLFKGFDGGADPVPILAFHALADFPGSGIDCSAFRRRHQVAIGS